MNNSWEKRRDTMKRNALGELGNLLTTVERTARHFRLWLEAEEHLAMQRDVGDDAGVGPAVDVRACIRRDPTCARCTIPVEYECYHNIAGGKDKALHHCSKECAILPALTP